MKRDGGKEEDRSNFSAEGVVQIDSKHRDVETRRGQRSHSIPCYCSVI